MDENLVLIFGFIIVIFAIMMRMIGTATERHQAHKERMAALKAGAAGGLDAAAVARLENMEQRLRVLERIATDSGDAGSADLAREIEALRLEGAGAGVPLSIKEPVR